MFTSDVLPVFSWTVGDASANTVVTKVMVICSTKAFSKTTALGCAGRAADLYQPPESLAKFARKTRAIRQISIRCDTKACSPGEDTMKWKLSANTIWLRKIRGARGILAAGQEVLIRQSLAVFICEAGKSAFNNKHFRFAQDDLSQCTGYARIGIWSSAIYGSSIACQKVFFT